MSYFQHDFISNSDIKSFKKSIGLFPEDPLNLQEIFDMGSLTHAAIFEPHETKQYQEKLPPESWELAMRMRDTFWADSTCRAFAMAKDFQREQPFYNDDVTVGPYKVKLRAKCDGVRTGIKMFMEFKGLNIDTEKAFRQAIVRTPLDYDQAVAHYMLTGKFQMGLIVGISKKHPERLFKWFVKAHDEYFLGGEQKLIESLTLLREYSPEDVQLAA